MSFQLASRRGRAVLVSERGWYDLQTHSRGTYPASIDAVIPNWQQLLSDAPAYQIGDPDGIVELADLDPVVSRPSKVIAIGLNYAPHAEESKLEVPDHPMVFPKFPNCITGPASDIILPSRSVDWEVELVLVIGTRANQVPEAKALDHVAGATIGQDISDRHVQLLGIPPQFGLGKSFDSFGPIGPVVVSLDQLDNLANLRIWCEINGRRVQDANTADMIFSPALLVSYLSHVMTLEPGDLIFTGTPAGVGMGANPPRYLRPGDVIECGIDGIGKMRNVCRDDGSAYNYFG